MQLYTADSGLHALQRFFQPRVIHKSLTSVDQKSPIFFIPAAPLEDHSNDMINWLIPKVPVRLINLPNKDYWFVPDRKNDTCRWLRVWLPWMTNATLVLLFALFHLTIRANLDVPRQLSNDIWWLLGLYVLFIILWSVSVFIRFGRPRDAK